VELSGAGALSVIAAGRPYDLVLCDVMVCIEVPFDMDGLRGLIERRARSFGSGLLA
jgi:CheY-like chemotaxis protein